MNIKTAFLGALTLGLLLGVGASAQQPPSQAKQPAASNATAASATTNTTTATTPTAATATKIIITSSTSPLDLARAAYAAQGGERWRNLKSMTLLGSVDLYSPNSQQSLPGKFAMVMAGERFRLEIQSPVFNFRQIYDGQQGFSSVRGMELPPPNKYGLKVLPKFEQAGYTVTALPNDKKRRAFRLTDPEGYATDFYIDPATGRVMGYTIKYNGAVFGVEHKVLKEIDGVLVPYSFVQRLELPQGAFFAEYKVKSAKVNEPVADDVFTVPAR